MSPGASRSQRSCCFGQHVPAQQHRHVQALRVAGGDRLRACAASCSARRRSGRRRATRARRPTCAPRSARRRRCGSRAGGRRRTTPPTRTRLAGAPARRRYRSATPSRLSHADQDYLSRTPPKRRPLTASIREARGLLTAERTLAVRRLTGRAMIRARPRRSRRTPRLRSAARRDPPARPCPTRGEPMNKILTTHAGSLIRPPAIVDYLGAIESGADYDRDAYARTLRDSVADIVEKQIEVGLDVIDDGEMGKATWITYLYERVSGLEIRPRQGRGQRAAAEPRPPGLPGRLRGARRARRGGDAREPRRPRGAPTRRAWRVDLDLHRPDRSTTAPRSTATSPTSRPRSAKHGPASRGSCRSSRRRAPTGSRTSTTAPRRSSCSGSPTRCTRSTRRSPTRACCSRSTTPC